MTHTQSHRQLAVGTSVSDDKLLLASLRVNEHLGRPFQMDLDLLSEDADVSADDLVGQNVTVRMELPEGGTRYFNGYVSRFVQTSADGRLVHYQATVVPWVWFLTRTADCRIFQEMTVPDIIKKVFRDHGFTDFDDQLTGDYLTWNYCVQYRETDFNFVSRLMEHEGIYYYFTHENGKHTLVLADSPSAHEPFEGYEEIAYRPPAQGFSGGEEISHWTVSQELQPGSFAFTDFDFEKPKKRLEAQSGIEREHANSDFEVFDYPGEYDQYGEGEQYAKVRIQEFAARYEIAQGQSDARGIAVGCTFKLSPAPRPAQSKQYLVVSSTLHASNDDFQTGSGGGESFSCSFTTIDAQVQYRPPRLTPKPVIQGPQTAIVVGKQGEEIWTDQYGRIKVQFHWDRYGKADENSSCWVRVAQLWAGKKWGAMYIPRIGQEVIVEFLEGDPDSPIVTGRVYNGDCMPPYDLPANATMSTIKSDSSKGGGGFNEIRFEDKKGAEQVFIHAQKRLDIRVRDNFYETNYGNREVRVGWENDGDSGGSYNVLVRQDHNLHVKGGVYELVEKQLNQTVKDNVLQSFEKDQTTFVKQTLSINAQELVIETAQQISQKTGQAVIQGAQAVHVKGGMVNIEGSTGISLKVGGNYVSITPAGVSIQGTMVMINSGGAAQSAQGAKAVAALSLEEPLDAAVADVATAGQQSTFNALARVRRSQTLTPQKASPWVPAPPVRTLGPIDSGSAPRPPLTTSTPPCGIAALEVQCGHGHGKRKVASNGILQVVPATGQTASKFSLKYNFAEFSVTKSHGGTDNLQFLVKSVDGKPVGRKQLCMKKSASFPSDGEWISGERRTEAVQSIPTRSIWQADEMPQTLTIFGRGCTDEDFHQATVQVFPSEQYELDISLEALTEHWRKWNEVLQAFNTASFGAVQITQQMTPPTGKLGAKLGWKENDDYRAYYAVEIPMFSLDPVCGQRLRGQVSLLTLAATASGPIVSLVSKFVSKKVDGYAFLAVGFGWSLGGSLVAKRYTIPSTEWETTGTVEFSGKGTFEIGLGLAANVWFVEARLEGKAITDLSVVGAFEFPATGGISCKPKVIFGEIIVKAVIVYGTHEEEDKADGGYSYRIRERQEIALDDWEVISGNLGEQGASK